jgi:RecA-family ATPase
MYTAEHATAEQDVPITSPAEIRTPRELLAASQAVATADEPDRLDMFERMTAFAERMLQIGRLKDRTQVYDHLERLAFSTNLTARLGDDVIQAALVRGKKAWNDVDFSASPIVADDPAHLAEQYANSVAFHERPPPDGIDDYGLAQSQGPELTPLPFLDATLWEGQAVTRLRWLATARIPAGNVALLSGDGAAGKTTIALQLCVATVLGMDWLGSIIDTPGPAIFFSAEEDSEEIHRRLLAILGERGHSFGDLRHQLHVHCIPGQDSVLGRPDRSNTIQPTNLFLQLELSAKNIRPALIVIEAAADVFAGNENDRSQVRQFIGLLRRLALASGAAVLLIQHPSLTGLASGSGTSGSTAWNNSVRSRLNFTAAKPRDGDDADPDVRMLRVMKSNYGPAGELVRLRWHNGVFVPEGGPSTIERAAAETFADDAFLRCLDVKAAQGINVGPASGKNYAPVVFEPMTEASGHKRRALAMAMERLLSAGRIRVDTLGPPSKRRDILVRGRQ